MNQNARKAESERQVFLTFIERSGFSVIRQSIRSGRAAFRESDIVCNDADGSELGFELSRVADPDLTRAINRRDPKNGEYMRLGGHSHRWLREKLGKSYSITGVQLLLYRENIGTPDNILVPQLRLQVRRRHIYSKIWYMGKDAVQVLYDRQPSGRANLA